MSTCTSMKMPLALAIMSIALAQPAWAGPHGGGMGGGMGGGLGAGAGLGAGSFGSSDFSRSSPSNFGGRSSTHVNSEAVTNSNGPNATDRDFGKARAEDRKHAGAAASTDTSSSASSAATLNGNGINATDRATGFDRATERMSTDGRTHNKAADHQQSDQPAEQK